MTYEMIIVAEQLSSQENRVKLDGFGEYKTIE